MKQNDKYLKEQQERLEEKRLQDVVAASIKVYKDERDALAKPLNDFLVEGLPSNAQDLKQILKNVRDYEPEHGAFGLINPYDGENEYVYIKRNYSIDVLQDFLNDFLRKTMNSMHENKNRFLYGDTEEVTQSISEYLRIISALYDIGYPFKKDYDDELGFTEIRNYLHKSGKK